MANEKTQAELDAQIDAGIKVNGNREITPPIHNAIEKAIVNSNLNKKDGGILQALAFYNTAFSLTDPLTLVYKSYVDNLVTALNALVQGINTLAENTTIYNNTFTLLLHSGVDGSETQAYKFSIEPAGVGMVYQDDGDPSNNASIAVAPGVVMVASGDLEITNLEKGIILSDANGSGARYRVTILDAAFNFELLP